MPILHAIPFAIANNEGLVLVTPSVFAVDNFTCESDSAKATEGLEYVGGVRYSVSIA